MSKGRPNSKMPLVELKYVLLIVYLEGRLLVVPDLELLLCSGPAELVNLLQQGRHCRDL